MAEKWPERGNTSVAVGSQPRSTENLKRSANGLWRWHIDPTPGTSCESLNFGVLKIADGKATSMVRHPQDGPFQLQGNVYDSGKISMAASGGHAFLTVAEVVNGETGKGKLEVAGEVNCTGKWTIEKEK